MLVCDGDGNGGHVIAVEVLEVIVEEGKDDIWLGGLESLAEGFAGGFGRCELLGLGCLGEANGTCEDLVLVNCDE